MNRHGIEGWSLLALYKNNPAKSTARPSPLQVFSYTYQTASVRAAVWYWDNEREWKVENTTGCDPGSQSMSLFYYLQNSHRINGKTQIDKVGEQITHINKNYAVHNWKDTLCALHHPF